MRRQLSAPVSLVIVLAGLALCYYVFHSHGWTWGGDASLAYIYRTLLAPSRFLVIAGLMISAWGTGNFLNALLLARRLSNQIPPSV